MKIIRLRFIHLPHMLKSHGMNFGVYYVRWSLYTFFLLLSTIEFLSSCLHQALKAALSIFTDCGYIMKRQDGLRNRMEILGSGGFVPFSVWMRLIGLGQFTSWRTRLYMYMLPGWSKKPAFKEPEASSPWREKTVIDLVLSQQISISYLHTHGLSCVLSC
jgi:hypothetical protein